MPHVSRMWFGSNSDVHSSMATLSNDVKLDVTNDVGASSGQLNYQMPTEYERNYENGAGRQRPREHWSWSSTACSIVACILCPACIYCTLGALACNLFAYIDHKAGDYKRKEVKIRCAVLWTAGSFLLGFITLIVVLVVLFAVFGAQNW